MHIHTAKGLQLSIIVVDIMVAYKSEWTIDFIGAGFRGWTESSSQRGTEGLMRKHKVKGEKANMHL